eukprot:3054523-Prymnesium_polylepis.1
MRRESANASRTCANLRELARTLPESVANVRRERFANPSRIRANRVENFRKSPTLTHRSRIGVYRLFW